MSRQVTLIKKETIRAAKPVSTFFLLCTILFTSCRNQHHKIIISGVVSDELTRKEISLVNVLLKQRDTSVLSEHYLKGAITDSLGYFEIEFNGKTSDHYLYIGKLGYEPLIINDLSKALDQREFKLVESKQKHIDFMPENLEGRNKKESN